MALSGPLAAAGARPDVLDICVSAVKASDLREAASVLLSLLWFFLGQFGLHVLHMTTAGPCAGGRCLLTPSETTAAQPQRVK